MAAREQITKTIKIISVTSVTSYEDSRSIGKALILLNHRGIYLFDEKIHAKSMPSAIKAT